MNRQELRGQLLEIGFGPYNGQFTDNQPANNKLNLDYENLNQEQHAELHDEVVSRLCGLAEMFEPEFVIGVPNGAIGLAQAVAVHYSGFVYNPFLKKDESSKTVGYATPLDQEVAEELSCGVLIEDVLNRRSTTQRVLRIPGLAPKIVAVIGIFDRSVPSERKPVGRPVRSLVSMEIPAIIDEEHELWGMLVSRNGGSS
ncbi:MAG TPA: hypothetical protein VK712_00960 [Verrucomicrobiae bacterium]|jgi:hypothetical protein|nr:hypothetical protein [Verrucomicrobiae bacterium]